jgi:nitrate/nitrite transporter NarK
VATSSPDLSGAWVAAEVLVVSLYSQEVLACSALAAGLVAIPQGVGGIMRGIVGPTLLDRVGVRRFLVGNCILAAAGLAVLFRFPMTSR